MSIFLPYSTTCELNKNDQLINDMIWMKFRKSPFYLGMFAGQQPTDVGEEEPTVGVVWVRVSIRKLVMLSVIPNPHVQAVLTG